MEDRAAGRGADAGGCDVERRDGRSAESRFWSGFMLVRTAVGALAVEGRGGRSLGVLVGQEGGEVTLVSEEAELRPCVWLGCGC